MLQADPAYSTNPSRRSFFRLAGSAAIAGYFVGKGLSGPVGFDPERTYREFARLGVRPMLGRRDVDKFAFDSSDDERGMFRAFKSGIVDLVQGENRASFAAYLRANGRVMSI